MNTLIPPENVLLLGAFVMIAATAAILLEQKASWAARIPGAVIALLIALAASNLGLVPTSSPVYDAVWSYVVPLAIPLLLFQIDLHSVFRESRRLLGLFLISSVGTALGAILGYLLLRGAIPELDKIAATIAASYTGGGVNFAAMTARLNPSEAMVASTIVADNLMMALYFVILITLAASGWVRRRWGSPYQDAVDQRAAEGTALSPAADYWKPKEISLADIATSLAAGIALVAVAFGLSDVLKGVFGEPQGVAATLLASLVTDRYLLLTTLTFLAVLLFPKQLKSLHGSQELGTYFISVGDNFTSSPSWWAKRLGQQV
ncbi:DUF819 family protein, partial [Deinococcus piscis]|uniref:DUF819 family protein n=1 Tax=Deinococcus piscis TaxID=394230 RepID=UPI001E320F27